ncbi:MAG: LysM peptidoglycan-binding domain-containing protein, partial [Myxococcota bacterium]
MAMAGGSEKASFTNLHTNKTFQVQFNPKEFVYNDTTNWKPKGNRARPSLTYEKGSPATVSFDLYFDTTRGGDDVDATYVSALRDLLEQTVRIKKGTKVASTSSSGGDAQCSPGEADPGEAKKDTFRPPYVRFSWGKFEFTCVVQKLGVTYMAFRPDGVPVRAKVSVTLMEHRSTKFGDGGTWGSGVSGISKSGLDATRQVKVAAGDTLSNIAAKAGVSLEVIARANGIENPLELEVGIEITIPGSEDIADALERAAQASVPCNWSDGGLDDVFGGVLDDLGDDIQDFVEDLEDFGEALEEIAETVTEVLDEVEETVDAIEESIEEATAAIDETVENLEESIDDVLDHAEETVDGVIDHVEEAIENAQEAVDDVIDHVEEAIENAGEVVEDAAKEVGKAAKQVKGAAKAVDETVDNVEEAVENVADTIEDVLGGGGG